MAAQPLSLSELASFLSSFGAAPLLDAGVLEEGPEETRYLVLAGGERYVVTVCEGMTEEDAVSAALLGAGLVDHGVPCAPPLKGRGGFVAPLAGKRASVARFLGGKTVRHPSPAHLLSLGAELARFHAAGEGFSLSGRPVHFARALCSTARELAARLVDDDPESAELLRAEADFQERVPEKELPAGLVHGALFSWNLLFGEGATGPRLVGFLGWERSGGGPLIYDLALVLADAAWSGPGIPGERARAFLAGYRAARPLQPSELEALPAYLRRAALRLLCSRAEALLKGGRSVPGGKSVPEELREHGVKLRLLRTGLHGAGPHRAQAA